ncbi:AMP-binding protein [Chloroflexota bacterium]
MRKQNFSEILRDAYINTPDKVAIRLLFSTKPDQALTYRELLHQSAIYAQALEKAGVQAGEVVILILEHDQNLVSAFFGAILHGAIPAIMPFLTEKLLPDQYRASLRALFEITAPAAVITYPQFFEEVRSASKETCVRALLVTDEIGKQASPPSHLNFAQLEGLKRSADDIVLLQHSSGTTGLQKGVALTHQAVFNQIDSYTNALRLIEEDVIVSWLPLYHDMGLIAGFILPVLTGTPLILMSPFDWVRAPYRLMKAMSDYQGTLCWLPNFAYNFCALKVRDRDLEGVDLTSIRAIINCSEPMYAQSHAIFLQRFQTYGLRREALATCYAMAENVFAVTQAGIEQPVRIDYIDHKAFTDEQIARPVSEKNSQAMQMLSAGPSIKGTRLRIIDAQGKDLPERTIGEIALSSNCMLAEYYKRPNLTEKAFLDGWYLTGDQGYLADGELYVTGRKKDLIIVGGKNIYPQDLEQLAGEVNGVHPGRVVAFGVYNERIGTEDVVIIAEASLKTADGQQKESIAAYIRQKVTRGSDIALRYVHIVERDWLTKTSSGKIARSANRKKYLEQTSQN